MAMDEEWAEPEQEAIPVETDWEEIADKLATALRLTQEFVGDELLPAKVGWSWFDALIAYNAAKKDADPNQ